MLVLKVFWAFFKIGLFGCKSIKEIRHCKNDGGLDIYSYKVKFDNGKSVEIIDTMEVS